MSKSEELPIGDDFAKLVLNRRINSVSRQKIIKDIESVLTHMTTPEIRKMILKSADNPKTTQVMIFAYKILGEDGRPCQTHRIMNPRPAVVARYEELGIKSLRDRLIEVYPDPMGIELVEKSGWVQVVIKLPQYSFMDK